MCEINMQALVDRVVKDFVDYTWGRDDDREMWFLLLTPLFQMTRDDEGLVGVVRLAHEGVDRVLDILLGDLFPWLITWISGEINKKL